MKSSCQLCAQGSVQEVWKLGRLPVCNRFLKSPSDFEELLPLDLGICDRCAVVQILNPVRPEMLRSPWEWMTYHEPEPHLDRLAEVLATLPGVRSDSSIAGITFKDDSTLRRLRERGFKNTWRLDPREDLGIEDSLAGIETIQERLDSAVANSIVARRGPQDVLIVRHILEHTSDIHRFSNGLKALLKPDGFLVFEVPDSQKAFESQVYGAVWEEHTFYFTSATFQRLASFIGTVLHRFDIFPYALENSMVVIMRATGVEANEPMPPELWRAEADRFLNFSHRLSPYRRMIGDRLAQWRQKQGAIALWGAGHQSGMLINLLELGAYLDCVVDDDLHKQGLFMPGSHLPVVSPAALAEKKIRLCLINFYPNDERKFEEKIQDFRKGGGSLVSMLPGSRYAWPNS